MSTFLIRYVLKAWGSRPGAPKMIYEYIPDEISLKAWGSRQGAPKRNPSIDFGCIYNGFKL